MKGLFSRLGIVARPFQGFAVPRTLGARIMRWQAANAAEPLLAADIIDMGNLLAYGDVDETGRMKSSAIELAYDQGRADFAKDLLAMMHLTPIEFNQLLKERPDEDLE